MTHTPQDQALPRPAQDPMEVWLTGWDAYIDYLGETARARSLQNLVDAYGRFIARCFELAADLPDALARGRSAHK